MVNIEIKTALKEARVYQWEVARFLNIGESVLSRMMRQELSIKKKEEILQAINQIKENRKNIIECT